MRTPTSASRSCRDACRSQYLSQRRHSASVRAGGTSPGTVGGQWPVDGADALGLDGETRARTGDTTIFRQALYAARDRESPGNSALYAFSSHRSDVRYLRAFIAGSGDGDGSSPGRVAVLADPGD